VTVNGRGPYGTRAWRTHQRAERLAAAGYRCEHCGYPGTDGRGRGLHQAHLVPDRVGGPSDLVIILCASCHRRYDAAQCRALEW